MEVFVDNAHCILKKIYSLSGEATATVTKLRTYPEIINNSYCRRLYIILSRLQGWTLDAMKDISLDLVERDLQVHFRKVLSTAPILEETYSIFSLTISLPPNHILVSKLKLQIDIIVVLLMKLYEISSQYKSLNDNYSFT
jgi:hypothetical protein